MKFRFIGKYTNGHTSISCHGVTFVGHDPSDVTGDEALRRLSGNIEFEVVDDAPVEPVGAPKRRGRKPKAAQ